MFEAKAELARKSFPHFIKAAWKHVPKLNGKELEWNWHHDALALHLQVMGLEWALAQKDPDHADVIQRIHNLSISIAPGTTKTLITMVFFPAWMWTRFPSWSVRCLSANPNAVRDSSDECRSIVSSAWYQDSFIPKSGEEWWAKVYELPIWEIRDDKDAKSDWGNTAGGSMRASGMTGVVTSEHTDWLLCDDPHSATQVNSPVMREAVVSKWEDELFNRVNDPRIACRVVIMQRLHPEDLVGHILEKDGKDPKKQRWCRIVIASEFEPDFTFETAIGWKDPRTKLGELLWPTRYGRKQLDEALATLMPRGYAAQHQQRPDVDTGVGFKVAWWNWFVRSDQKVRETWERPPGAKDTPAEILHVNKDGTVDVDWVCVTVDPTFGSTSEEASGVGLLIIAGKKEKRYILDDLSPGPRGFNDQVDDIKKAVFQAVRITGKRVIRVLVENKAGGGPGIEVLEKQVKQGDFNLVDGKTVVIHFEKYDIKSSVLSKEQRGMSMEPDLFAGVIYLPEGVSWITTFLSEFRRFPAPPNDRVDALAQALERYRKGISWATTMLKIGR